MYVSNKGKKELYKSEQDFFFFFKFGNNLLSLVVKSGTSPFVFR